MSIEVEAVLGKADAAGIDIGDLVQFVDGDGTFWQVIDFQDYGRVVRLWDFSVRGGRGLVSKPKIEVEKVPVGSSVTLTQKS